MDFMLYEEDLARFKRKKMNKQSKDIEKTAAVKDSNPVKIIEIDIDEENNEDDTSV